MEEFIKDYYSANLAHDKTQQNIEHKVKKSLSEIFNKYINKAVDNGKFYAEIPESLIDENIKDILNKLGYIIKTKTTGINETCCEILW